MHCHKTGNNDILDKVSFWYHCKKHTFSFHLVPRSPSYSLYFLRYDHLWNKTVSGVWSFMHRTTSIFPPWKCGFKRHLKFPIPSFVYDRLQKMQYFLWVTCVKISQNLHGVDRNHIMVWKIKILKPTNELFFTLCYLWIVNISKGCVTSSLFSWTASHVWPLKKLLGVWSNCILISWNIKCGKDLTFPTSEIYVFPFQMTNLISWITRY